MERLLEANAKPPAEEQQREAEPSIFDCAVESGRKNGVNLLIDTGGLALVVASAKFQIAASIGGSVLGAVGIGISVANGDLTGVGLAYGGKTASVAGGIAAVGSALERGATRFGAAAVAVSTARDLAQAYNDFSVCRSGTGQ